MLDTHKGPYCVCHGSEFCTYNYHPWWPDGKFEFYVKSMLLTRNGVRKGASGKTTGDGLLKQRTICISRNAIMVSILSPNKSWLYVELQGNPVRNKIISK